MIVQAKQINAEGNVDELSGTFAFGNEDVGYTLFANSKRVKIPLMKNPKQN